jgi:hypothetical protein
MIPLILLGIITVVIVSDAVIKPSIFKYAIMLFSGVFAIIVSFNYYETLGRILFEKDILPNHIYALSFLLLNAVSFIIFKIIGDKVIRAEIKFPGNVSKIGSVVCSLLFALLVTGAVLVFAALLPMSPKYPYARFADKVVLMDQYANLNPDKPFISPDAFVAGIFKNVSAGSFSSSNSFAVLHGDFLNSIYLNRHNIKDDENPKTAMTGLNAIKISTSDKNTVRKAHTNLRTKEGKEIPLIEGKELYIIKCPFNLMREDNGGALEGGTKIELLPCQIRTLCNDSYENGLKGNGNVAYPYGYLDKNGRFVRTNITEIISFDINRKENNTHDVALAFYVPQGNVPVAIGYKQNFIAKLPPEPTKEDNETETEQN